MAVYTTVSSAALASFLADYDIGQAVDCQGIAEGIENSNFLLTTDTGSFILTLYERRMKAEELPWFLGLMRHLSARGLACPTPVAGRDGETLRHLAERPAAVTTFLPGRPTPVIDASACHALGVALAQFHAWGRDYVVERRNALGPEAWQPLLDSCHGSGDDLQPELTSRVSTAIAEVTREWPAADSLPRGQIHADLFPDNVFFRDGALSGIIDFYFACTDHLAYDLAICINAWCFPDEARLDMNLARALLAGYESVRALEPVERFHMTRLCQGAALRFLLTRLYDWVNTPRDALVTRKDPLAYWSRLQAWQAPGAGFFHE
ncbi:homoserine kinase [Neoasaia chiangmaiensis NBRC 101099]|uniref:Homoserine kinase n=1 Tax=Neoasaia chiangmaiensis TaxID=320497 RepID=A0A1U9KQU4_9PROT|nr:homoserine kinase [Neoasaia chiangmaiensis]AQS88231.1 homoserine kinase [Neoasaia chiangmaiensis]GBR39789.1 homoserine kinase [Neoasaia chiangmaiensis NBRC 101099]GEN14741.1 homoserine kinase [Neoasaia chiangmaiensis]